MQIGVAMDERLFNALCAKQSELMNETGLKITRSALICALVRQSLGLEVVVEEAEEPNEEEAEKPKPKKRRPKKEPEATE